jgi:hypothetical protein
MKVVAKDQCARPTGEAMLAPPPIPRKAKGRAEELPTARPGGIIKAGAPPKDAPARNPYHSSALGT